MTLEETLKYMESRLQETSVNGLNQIINSQNLSNEIKIQQGQGNDIIINGIKYPGPIGKTALNTIAMQIHPDKTQGLSKDQILKNVITATAGINKGSIGKSIQQNMSLPQPANSNQNLPANQGQNQLIIKKNGQELSPESQEYKELQTVAQKVGIEKAQQMYQQQGYNVEFTPPTQLEDNRAQTQALPPPQESINELSTSVSKNTPALINTEIPNFDKFNELSELLNNDLDKILVSVKTLANTLNNNPTIQQNQQLQQNIQNLDNTIDDDEDKSNGFKNFLKGFGSLLKGGLNTVAGMAGNFIGGIASGMGAAK